METYTGHPPQSPAAFAIVALAVAFRTSMAAGASLALSLPVWAMFVGGVAFFTRGLNTRTAIQNLTLVWIGLWMVCTSSPNSRLRSV